jgi:hypothetical protein
VTIGEDGSVEPSRQQSPADLIEQPAKVMRIGSMVKQLLEEVRQAPLDDASRTRCARCTRTRSPSWPRGWRPSCARSWTGSRLPFTDDQIPSDAELRIAQAQLVGWLEGLFHGIQTALFAQQMAARVQLEQMRGRVALPQAGVPQPGPQGPTGGTGQYL